MEPDPSNVTGKVVESHSFEHVVRWDYALIAVVVLYVLWRFFPRQSDDEDGESGGILQ